MTPTMTQVIGQNVKTRREDSGMTAKQLGEELGRLFPKIKDGESFPRAWPTSAVYMMEAGDRSMIAAEVAALAQVLGTTVARLFTPPVAVDFVRVGNLTVPREDLSASGLESVDATALATIERDLKWIWQNTDDTSTVISRVQDQIKGYREAGEVPAGVVAQMLAESAQHQERVRRSDAEWAELEDEDDGEGN